MRQIVSLMSGLAFVATSAAAEETDVVIYSDEQPFVGTLNVPGAAEAAPVVLLLHGFGSGRNELASDAVPEGVYARTAARLAEAGYASLRVAFRGSGESTADLSFADTTFESQIADAGAAVAYLQTLSSVDASELYVIGWSQGGLVASALAGRSGAVDGVALWNAVGDPQATYGALFGADSVVAAIDASPDDLLTMTTPWGAEFLLKGAFFDDVSAFDPIAEIASYDGPLFVASGASDTLVHPSVAEAFLGSHNGAQEAWHAEMDHVFNIFATDETLEQLIDATVAFFDD
ncbi:MAG: alpha/beta fold hydrolase [Pseudomonadota bacterium]